MSSFHRLLVLSLGCSALLAGCGSSSSSSTTGSSTGLSSTTTATTGSTATSPTSGFSSGATNNGTHNSVMAAVTSTTVGGVVSVVVGAKQTVSVTFNSDDGRPATGLALTDTIGKLPAGWTLPSNFGCASVSTGGGCVLNLTYAPTEYTESGTVTLKFLYVDNAQLPVTQNGTMTFNYQATTHNNAIAEVQPAGQVARVVGQSAPPVTITFTTDDMHPAFNVSADLSILPAGWSAAAPQFTCASLSTGNGCQLSLAYAPTADAAGTLALNFTYLDDSSVAKTASISIPYAATTNNNVTNTPNPSGQITAVAGVGTQTVTVNFAPDDVNPAYNLDIADVTGALPAGWSSPQTSLDCVLLDATHPCQLMLTYAPTVGGSGTLSVPYLYQSDAGFAKTGAVSIPYQATTQDNAVYTFTPSPAVTTVGASIGVSLQITTDDGAVASALSLVLSALPSEWVANGATTCSAFSTGTTCTLQFTYSPTSVHTMPLTLNIPFSYTDNAGTSKTATATLQYQTN